MHEIELYDGTYLQAYKHTATRRYLHLAEDGRAFLYLRGDAYTPVDRRRAIDLAFECWRELCPEEEREVVGVALHRARAAADEQLER